MEKVADTDHEPRFMMLETIREYALQKLIENGEEETVRRAHATYFATLAEQAKVTFPDQPVWQRRLVAERDNIRSALQYWHENQDDPELELSLVAAIAFFWWQQSYYAEAQHFFEKALARINSSVNAWVNANVFHEGARLYGTTGDFHRAVQLQREAVKLRTELEDKQNIADELGKLAQYLLSTGETVESRRSIEEALAIARKHNPRNAQIVISDYGIYMLKLGRLAQAEPYLQEALDLAQKMGNNYMTLLMFNQLAYLYYLQGDLAKAVTYAEQNHKLAEELGNPRRTADALFCLALAAQKMQRLDTAINYAEDGFKHIYASGDVGGTTHTLFVLGDTAFKVGNYQWARSLYKEMLRLYSLIQAPSNYSLPNVIRVLQRLYCMDVSEYRNEQATTLWAYLEALSKNLSAAQEVTAQG